MPNQTPHTPQTQIPSSINKKGIIAIKPPIISPEIYERFEQLITKPFSKETIEAVKEAQRKKREREEQQNQIPDYTEVAGLKVLTQDLDKPQCPKVKLLKEGQKHKKCCCWELEFVGQTYYQYDIYGALKEAEFRGMEILSYEDWIKLEEELGIFGLKKFLLLNERKNYKGCCSGGIRYNHKVGVYYWSSSVYSSSSTLSWRRYLDYSSASVDRHYTAQSYAFLVRCRLKD